MRLSNVASAAALLLPLLAASAPLEAPYKSVKSVTATHIDSEPASTTHNEDDATSSDEETSNQPWQVFSLLKKPFEDSPLLSFVFRDPNTKYETNCRTSLPMSGYVLCEDGDTMFLYGGMSYQYGETWLAITRQNVHTCDDRPVINTTSTGDCEVRGASGTVDFSHTFWQQPGWNSWVHPEEMQIEWGWV